MAIDFHSGTNRSTYASRQANPDWKAAIRRIVDPSDKRVADIGCGGGIYSRAWRELGAESVVGVDFSQAMVDTAREQSAGLAGISFQQGDAAATGLQPGSVDIVFERALIHHLQSCYWPCFAEAQRVLTPGGALIVQDRTPDDVQLPGSAGHLRGYRERLRQDLANRTGRSILHDLNDEELAGLILYIEKRLPCDGAIVEKDRWTVWSAVA